jgi:hypothetical protein
VHAKATEVQLAEILGRLGVAVPPALPSVRKTVLSLLDFNATMCVQAGSHASGVGEPEACGWDVFERLAESVRQLVDTTADAAKPVSRGTSASSSPMTSAGSAVARPLVKWEVSDVCVMLHKIKLGEHAASFQREGVCPTESLFL